MWILLGIISILFLLVLYIRRNKELRIYLFPKLYPFGIQLGTHIYTPVCDVWTEFRYFDIVLLKVHQGHLHGIRILTRERFTIKLTHVEVGQHLKYDGPQDLLYMEGTPFQVEHGHLILYQRKRKGYNFTLEEVKKSKKWPM